MPSSKLSDRVAWALDKIDLSNEELASVLGVNKNTIANYKKGKGDLKGIVLEGLVQNFGFHPQWLLIGTGIPQSISEDKDLNSEPKEAPDDSPIPSKTGTDDIHYTVMGAGPRQTHEVIGSEKRLAQVERQLSDVRQVLDGLLGGRVIKNNIKHILFKFDQIKGVLARHRPKPGEPERRQCVREIDEILGLNLNNAGGRRPERPAKKTCEVQPCIAL